MVRRVAFGRRRVVDLYAEYAVEHDRERTPLLRLVCDKFRTDTVLYPGCFLHVTPSFWFQHVVYVDRNDLARQRAHIRFVHQDFTQPLPLAESRLADGDVVARAAYWVFRRRSSVDR